LSFYQFFTRTLQCSVRQLDPLEQKNFRKNPQELWRWNEIIQLTLEPWSTRSISLNGPTYNPYITLAILWLKEQTDSKKKCLILKKIWTMIFWDLEIIDATDSMIWVLWGSEVYIENGGKCKFSSKNNYVNWFTSVNRFRQH